MGTGASDLGKPALRLRHEQQLAVPSLVYRGAKLWLPGADLATELSVLLLQSHLEKHFLPTALTVILEVT